MRVGVSSRKFACPHSQASFPGSFKGGVESLVHTVCACTRIYGKGSVHVSLNNLSRVAGSTMEAIYTVVSGRKRN